MTVKDSARLAKVQELTMFTYLDDLRESGVTNMFGAGSYLEAEYGLNRNEAKDVLMRWMRNFKR